MTDRLEPKQVVGQIGKDGLASPVNVVFNPRLGATIDGTILLHDVQLCFPEMASLIDPNNEESLVMRNRVEPGSSPGLVERIRFENPVCLEIIKDRRIGIQTAFPGF